MKDTLRDTLNRFEVLDALTPSLRDRLAPRLVLKRFDLGETIYDEGDPA